MNKIIQNKQFLTSNPRRATMQVQIPTINPIKEPKIHKTIPIIYFILKKIKKDELNIAIQYV
jgi:hypothetical protein